MYEWIGKLTKDHNRLRRWSVRLGRLPSGVVVWLLTGLGLLLALVAVQLRRTVEANMRECLTYEGQRELRRHTRSYFIHAVFTLYELLLDSHRLPKQGERLIAVEGETFLQEVLKDGKGAILYVPHAGNFFYYLWLLSQRYDCMAVATASSSELRPIYLNFQRMGCKGLDYDETPPLEMLRQLKAHLAKGGVLFIMGDFHREGFPITRLFGRPTRAPAGAAAIALEDRVPIIPCYGYRERGFRHRIVLEKPVRLYQTYTRKERGEALQWLQHLLEGQIRRVPEQWFYWFNTHERWDREDEGGEYGHG